MPVDHTVSIPVHADRVHTVEYDSIVPCTMECFHDDCVSYHKNDCLQFAINRSSCNLW